MSTRRFERVADSLPGAARNTKRWHFQNLAIVVVGILRWAVRWASRDQRGMSLLLLVALLPCPSARSETSILLRDVPSTTTGITFRHTDGSSGRRYIVETVASGLATFDYDNDERIDIYFLNGAPLPGMEAATPPRNRLYRNLGGWKFVDVTQKAGLGDVGYGLGVAVADYDQDGFADVYVSNFGPNVLLHNNGDGTFSNVTAASGTGGQEPSKVGAGACFLDADGDGDLDLFVANYLHFWYDEHVPRTYRGVPIYRGPESYRPLPSTLYVNHGDGTFTDGTRTAGVDAPGWGMGMVGADFDDDGDTDVFVANDSMANYLWQNDGTGRFEEVGLLAGVGYNFRGDAHGNMGVDCGDFDNDGRLDFYVTSYQSQTAMLCKNVGHGFFQDVTLAAGAGAGTAPFVTWGCGFVDFDNDADRDVFIACGHLLDNVERFDDTTSYHAQNVLLMNMGRGRFADVSRESGDGMAPKRSSRGAAFDDLDNDGDIDVVVLNARLEPTILRNDSRNDHHWLQVRLVGVHTNRDGVGARVKVVAGDLVLIDEVHSGRGYQSHYGMRLHFGLGTRKRVDRVEVRWIGGGTDVFEQVPLDQRVMLVERSRSLPGDE